MNVSLELVKTKRLEIYETLRMKRNTYFPTFNSNYVRSEQNFARRFNSHILKSIKGVFIYYVQDRAHFLDAG